jgi:hypothetical protein
MDGVDPTGMNWFSDWWGNSDNFKANSSPPSGDRVGGSLNSPANRPMVTTNYRDDAIKDDELTETVLLGVGGILKGGLKLGVEEFGFKVFSSGAGSAAKSVAAKAILSDGALNVSRTVANQLASSRSFIPSHAILQTILHGARSADPQKVAGQFMYRIGAGFAKANNQWSNGELEVLINENSGTIVHVLYKSNR